MPPFNSALISVHTTINAPPAKVRAFLLDFSNLPNWSKCQRIIDAISIERPTGNDDESSIVPGIEAQAGDIARVISRQAGEVRPVISENTPMRFGYKGSGMGFYVVHYWEFLPSPEGDGKTLLAHCEAFEGGLAFLNWRYGPLRGWIEGLFRGFNEDLKAGVEGS